MLPPLIYKLPPEELQKRAEARKLRGVFHVENDHYHQGPGVSSTGIKKLLVSPAHFKAPTETTQAMHFGTALHMAVLEPELFAATYVCAPDCDKRTKAGKAEWDAWVDTVPPTAQVLTDANWKLLTKMAHALGKSDVFRGLLRETARELTAYALCKETGVLRKARADIIGGGLIADVKTCQDSNPDDFAKTIYNFGYHISAAYYLDVFADVLGVPLDTFVIIAVEKSYPFGVRFFSMSKKMLEVGRSEYQRALALYRECSKTDAWPAYADEVTLIDFPDWIYRRNV